MVKVKFPHFTLEEAKVLEEFQKLFFKGAKWQYDVRLESRKAKLPESEPEPFKIMWKKLTAKRIDALVETSDAFHIIEVKRVMLPSGIGQLLVYAYMFNEQFKPKKMVKLWYVTYYNDPDVEHICKQLGINTWSVVKL